MSDPTDPEDRTTSDTDVTRSAWDDVGAHLSKLGEHVRQRFDQSGGATRADSGEEGDSVRRWIDTLDDAFTSLGDAVRDPAFRRDAEASAERLADALGDTLTDLGEQLRQRFGRAAASPADPGTTEPPSGDEPPATA